MKTVTPQVLGSKQKKSLERWLNTPPQRANEYLTYNMQLKLPFRLAAVCHTFVNAAVFYTQLYNRGRHLHNCCTSNKPVVIVATCHLCLVALDCNVLRPMTVLAPDYIEYTWLLNPNSRVLFLKLHERGQRASTLV